MPEGRSETRRQRRRGEVLERAFVVGVAAKAAEQPWWVENERRADQRDARCESALERNAQLPAARRRRLEQRVRGGRPHRVGPAGAEQGARAAVDDRLGRGDADDEVRLGDETVDPQRRATGAAEVDQVGRLGIVHLDLTPKAARRVRLDEHLELTLARSAVQPARDQNRLPLRRDAESLQLGDRRRKRLPARIVGRARHRQLGRLDDDRRPPAARDQRFERRAGEGKAERISHSRADVGDRLRRWRRAEHHRVLGRVDDGDAGARRDRDSDHYGMCRYSRRNVSRKPRPAQNRDASRLATRQSATIVS